MGAVPIEARGAGQYSALQHHCARGFRVSDPELHPMSPQDCLVALMIAVSAADETLRTAELVKIQSTVNHLPVFADFDADRIQVLAQVVFDLFEQEDGLDALFGLLRDNLPERLFETAYALSCDVAAADGTLQETELRLLEEIRYELNIDRLHAAAIERGARARHMRA
ncbi:MAG: tellurite resistance TerB family protein [Roseivivax sp.]|nr:tellurite resistance TerB family protein [Roseivivax sp.]